MEKIKILCITLLITLLISGCGRKEVEYNPSATEDNVQDDSDNDDINTMNHDLMKMLGAGEEWETVVNVQSDRVKGVDINVEVDVPELERVKVTNAKVLEFDSDTKKKYLNMFTEEPVYYYDDEYLPKSEIQKQLDALYKYMETVQDMIDEGVYDNDAMNYYEEIAGKLEELSENASDDFVLTDESYASSSYMVKYNDMKYFMTFGDNEWDTYIALHQDTSNENKEFYCDEVNYGTGENRCDMSVEQIDKIAVDFLENMGIKDFKPIQHYKLKFYDDESEWYDGCYVELFRTIDGVMVDGSSYENVDYYRVYTEDELQTDDNGILISPRAFNYGLEHICLSINNDGVIAMEWDYPLQITGVAEDDAKVLPIDSVKDIMCELAPDEAIREFEYTSNVKISYNTLEFMYYRCKESDESDDCSIIPVWRMSYIDADGIKRCLMINAIDGNKIDIDKDLFH